MAFRSYLNNVIGFATNANDNRVIGAGLDNFDTLSEFDKEDVQSLCRTLRKDSNNPMTIGPIIEKRLMIAAILSKHYLLMGRPLNSTSSLSSIHEHDA